MEHEKRHSQPPIPDNLDDYLNHQQLMALKRVESFGWTLHFVRRPSVDNATPVVMGPHGQLFGVIEANGTINQNIDFAIRD